MKLYEINQAIEELVARLEPDPETGEVTADFEAVLAELDGLQMKRSDILCYLAKLVLDNRAEQTMLKAEEKRLKERRSSLEGKEERIMRILDRECAGEKTDCGVATVNYRKTTRVDISDNLAAVDWLEKNGYDDYIRYAEPEVSKTDIKKLLADGTVIPGAAIIQDLSCSLK